MHRPSPHVSAKSAPRLFLRPSAIPIDDIILLLLNRQNGLLLHVKRRLPCSVHLRWKRQIREYGPPPPAHDTPSDLNPSDEDLIKYGLEKDVWYCATTTA